MWTLRLPSPQPRSRHKQRRHSNACARKAQGGPDLQSSEPEPPKARRFHGSVVLDPLRLGRDATEIANEIVQHLMKQPGAKVELALEIQADIPNGAPDDLTRTVSENCRTLKFRNFDFEEN